MDTTQLPPARSLRQAGVGPEWLKLDTLAKAQTPFQIERATERHQAQSNDLPARDVYDFDVRLLAGPERGAGGIVTLGKADKNGAPYESRAKLFRAVQDGPIGPVMLVKVGNFYAVEDCTQLTPANANAPAGSDGDDDRLPF